uniref:Uncharacterized protein n=1 Tax=viral metagenome TaxID=1070528 RepID=A0A6H2A5B6_9ZZZZ
MDKVRAFLKCVMSEDQIESQISSDLLVEFYTRDLEEILDEYEKLIGAEKTTFFCPNESQVCITRKNGKIVGLAIMKCRHCGRNILVSHLE